jgi:hypothetical protein
MEHTYPLNGGVLLVELADCRHVAEKRKVRSEHSDCWSWSCRLIEGGVAGKSGFDSESFFGMLVEDLFGASRRSQVLVQVRRRKQGSAVLPNLVFPVLP